MLSSVSQLFQDNTTVILGAVAGLGAVSAYGLTTPCLGDSKINGKIWEEHVRHRVRSTFAYVLGTVGVTAGAAYLGAQSSMVNSLARMGVIPLSVVSAAVVYISGSMTRSIPYENTLLKISSWACHYGAAGLLIPPLCSFGGPVMERTLIYLGGLLAGGAVVGICTPSRQFFTNAVPIGNLFGVVIAAKIADSYLPKESELTGWTGIAIYAGLVLWAIYDHWDHHRVVDAAEKIPIIGGATGHERYFDKYGMQTLVSTGNGDFDPINAQMSCIMDLPNILFRVPKPEIARE